MNIDAWLNELDQEKCIPEKDLKILCDKVKVTQVKEILIEEPNAVPVAAPVTLCGDIHGQFHDLKELFKQGGPIETTNYVFMGDYVDRGYYSLETFEYLLCLKVK